MTFRIEQLQADGTWALIESGIVNVDVAKIRLSQLIRDKSMARSKYRIVEDAP